jgi:hypothetical protein
MRRVDRNGTDTCCYELINGGLVEMLPASWINLLIAKRLFVALVRVLALESNRIDPRTWIL